jgi:hypothetical protein
MGVERSIEDDEGKSGVNSINYQMGMLCIEQNLDKTLWVYVGSRKTRIGTINRVFCRVVDSPGVFWPHCLWTYIASKEETIRKNFYIP